MELKKEKLLVDLTSSLSINRLTGVQRVALSVASQVNDVTIVRFNEDRETFEIVEELPPLRFRDERYPRSASWVARVFQVTVWSGLRFVVSSLNPQIWTSIFRFGTVVFNKRLTEFSRPELPRPPSNEVDWEKFSKLWLLDIPKSGKHIEAILELVLRDRVSLFLYFYDLIPIDLEKTVGQKPDPQTKALFLQYLKLASNATGIAFLSEFSRRRYESYAGEHGIPLPPARATVYPPLAEVSCDPHSGSDRSADLLRKMRLSSQTSLVLCVAPMIKRKNLVVVLRAFRILFSRKEDVALVIVTPVLSTMDSRTVLAALGLMMFHPRRIKIVNPVSEATLIGLYRAARYVAVPSLLEGYGLPVIEAYQHRTPVLVADSDALLEVSHPDWTTVLPGKSPQMWADAILRPTRDIIFRENALRVTGMDDFLEALRAIQNKA